MTRWIKLGSIALVIALCTTALSTANAQAQTPAPTQPASGRAQIVRTLTTALLGAAEKETSLSQSDIMAELGSGKTLADVLKEHNVDVATVEADAKTTLTTDIAQALSSGKLTQAQADQLTSRIDPALNRLINFQFPLKKDSRLERLRAAGLNILIKTTADVTKLTQRDLLQEIRSGKTLAQIATEHDADPTQIVSTAVTQATDRVNKALKAGKIKDDEAKTLLANLQTGLTSLMNTAYPLGKGGKGNSSTGSQPTQPAPEGTPSL